MLADIRTNLEQLRMAFEAVMRIHRVRSAIILATLCLAAAATRLCAQSGAPTLSVDVGAARNAISQDIYGIANYGLDAAFAREIKVGNVRWGGDGTTRYNWMVDSSNSGFDWYFIGGSGETAPVPGATPDLMVKTYAPADALITIPIIPYVNSASAYSCSFPESVYGAQQSYDPYLKVNGGECGNSLTTSGKQLTDTNILANHIVNTTALQQQWVAHLVSTFGTGADGGVKFYQLDNEPGGWSNTHRDVMPSEPAYSMIVQYGQEYAAAVKTADPSALVLGPSDFTLGGWIGNTSQQNGLYAGQYYLQQMAAYQQAHGRRLLDYFDEHYYFNVSSPAAQLAATRTLWDPTYNGGTWVEQYDFDGPMQLIPRFKGWISTYYPGTKLAISEYSIDSGQKSIVDAIAEMDVLGIFGREQLDFASMWTPPAPTDPIAYAFRMFRNYDGNGSQFGDTSVSAVSSDQATLSIYAAQRSTDNAVTVLVVNKTTAAIAGNISFANLSLPASAQVYTYSAANLAAIVPAAAAPVTNSSVSYSFPGYSAVMFVVQPPAAAPPPADNYSLSLSATALTASASKPGTLMLTMTPSGGSATAESFACSGLPSGWSCSFAAASLSGSTPQSTTVTVATMSAAQSAALRSGIQMALVGPLPLLLVGARSTRRTCDVRSCRSRRGRARARVLKAALGATVLCALTLVGCGGGSGGDSSAPSTQSYTVTVTSAGTSGTPHSAQFTLTVSS
jgi:hypothetical protein